MTVPESITRISGPPYETGAFKPIILNDPEQIIVVQQGHLDIFAVRGSKTMTLARHPFVTRVSAGQAAFGGPELAGNQPEQHGFYFLAVPSRNAVIMETERSRLNDRKAIDINTVVLIDGWIANLSEVLSRNQILPPRDIQLLEADPNVPYPAGQAVGAHHLDVIWISANQPMQFIGNQDIVIPAKTLFPLSEWTWLHLTADTEISAVHTPALLGSERLCLALDNYSSLLLKSAEYLDEKNAANIQQHSLSNRKEREQVKSTIFWNISQVLNRTPDGKAVTPTSGLPPLLAVASLVARSVGGTMNTPSNGDEETTTADDMGILSTQARLSRIRTREIALAHDWYRRSGPSFIGRSINEKKPLALISNGLGSYQAVDPEAGRTWPINRRRTAENIERQGVMFYSPLPDRIKAGLKALLHVMSRYGRDIRLLITMATLGGLIALLTPVVTGELLAEIIPRGETEMWIAALGALGLGALGTAVLDIVGAFAALRIEGRTDEQLQASVWGRLVALPTSFFRRFTAGDLADRANGIGMIRQLLTGATVHGLISSVFSIFSLALLFYYSWLLALFACGISLVLIAGSWFLVKRQVRHYRTAFGKQGLIDGFVFQMITGISKLRIANAEYHALALWAEQFAAQRRDTLTARFWGGGQHTVNAIFMPLSLVVLFTFIWYSLIEGGAQESFDLADFLSFNAAFGQFAASIVGLTGAWTTISSAVPLFERVQPILECPYENNVGSYAPADLTGHIEFARVTFRYLPNAPNAVEDVSFRIQQGDYVAFVGSSGSGKSTIYRLLLGFERPDSGAVLIDGHDLLHLNLPAVRNLMGVVVQDGKLVAASIFENISGSSALTMDEAWAAARAAGLEDDIRAMPMGMHTVIPEGGLGLSGGQKQRVLIAHALARKPRIMLFDEATSALDNRTQLTVQESLRSLNITRIVIAHRLSTIRDADRIFVMKEGRIVETGRYEELMARDGFFAELAKRQIV